jgi:hypothetical protein
LSAITRNEHTAELFIVDHARVQDIWVLVVGEQSAHLTVGEAFVRCNERRRVVGANQHAATIGSKHYAAGVTRIDHHVVDDNVRRRYAMPAGACVLRLPQTFRRSGKDYLWMTGVLFQHAGTPR